MKMFADVQERVEYILSLQDTICSNYRKMTEQEVTLKEKVSMDERENYAIINHIILVQLRFLHYCCHV